MRIFLLCFLLMGLTLAHAEESAQKNSNERPNEGSLFGSDQQNDVKGLDTAAPPSDAFASGEVKDNPLEIGGIFYQRMIVSGQSGAGASDAPLSLPLQFDGFLDARPSDRIRGFVDERLLYDSTRDQYSNTTGGKSAGSLQFSSTSAAPTSVSTTTPVPNNPQAVLDQAWLKFDINRTVFVTAGKQHVKWGTGRYWNPTDFLSTQKRDPLLPYDLRLGNTMAKFEIPWEAKKTNFYAIALFDNPQPASTLGQMGAAFRAEKVIGNTEVGFDFVSRGGRTPVYGADISAPLGPFDVYAEAAVVSSATTPTYTLVSAPVTGADLSALFSSTQPKGPFLQTSVGGNYTFGWKENRQAVLGAEYFYNQLGYTTSTAYPILIFNGQYQPFYTGKNYAAVYLTAEGPDSEKHTNYTFSTLGNLSDKSFISRIDFSWRVLTYLTFESYLDGHYGSRGGEFNFTLNTPTLGYQGKTVAALSIPPTFFDIGTGLRLSF